MRLTSKGRYAVAAMADLSAQASAEGGAASVRLHDIAARQAISLAYLEQLFSRLKRAGLVTAARGPQGGYRLARPAAEITVAEVIAAVDEGIATTACRTGGPLGCTGKRERCMTHNLWAALGERIEDYLSAVSLDDLSHGRVGGRVKAAALEATP